MEKVGHTSGHVHISQLGDQAEYGSVLGGVVNVVTRGGTNQLHGSGWEFLRNNIFDTRDHFKDVNPDGSPAPPAAFRQNQFGAMLSLGTRWQNLPIPPQPLQRCRETNVVP